MLRHPLKNSLFIISLLLLSPLSLQGRVVEQIVTVIDGEPYTLTNIATYAKSKMAREFPIGSLEKINGSDREVLEQFITEKLLDAEIREAGIKVTDQDIEVYIDQIKQKNRLTDADLKAALSREGQTMQAYKASVRAELEKGELINRQVRKKVNITNEDVERYYKLNPKNYRADDRARIRHILLPLSEKASPEEVQAATAKANELYEQIAAGEDFAGLAQKHSDGAGRESGGDIGWVNRGTLLKPIEDAAFEKLSVGQVSRPIRSSMGLHLVKLESREIGAVLPLSSVASKIKEELYTKAMEERYSKWLKTELRRKHTVDVKIAGVVFKPEDSKEDTMGSLMAKSTRLNRREDRGLLGYLNPLSYVVRETASDEEDQKTGPLAGKNIVSVFGVPLFTRDRVDDVPDILSPAVQPEKNSQAQEPDSGFFSSIVNRLNPFKR
ncbi:MAG TPA: peptidylprolyl isomerase [Candidatus Binatia bacterium]|jgi:parvulin-like peptidyl-prolyl isomerase